MLYNCNLSNINEKDGPKNKKNSILKKQKQPNAKKDKNNRMPKKI